MTGTFFDALNFILLQVLDLELVQSAFRVVSNIGDNLYIIALSLIMTSSKRPRACEEGREAGEIFIALYRRSRVR